MFDKNIRKAVSVIIPIYNAEKFLPYLFECLDSCGFNSEDEILLIDNNSTDRTNEMCRTQVLMRPELYHLFSYIDKADSYAARNYAVSLARGDIFAFTDSDCKPTPQWLYEIKHSLQPGEVLAGKIDLEIIEGSLWETFDSVTHLGQTEEHLKNNCVATANMSVHRDDFYKVGQFEERFSGGDFEWSKRAYNAGLRIHYAPEALIIHPSRKTYDEILNREKRTAYGAGRHQQINRESFILLMVKYFLKIFKIDTNIRLSLQMKESGIEIRELIVFNLKFFQIRAAQLVSAIKGYKQVDARKIGVR